jgi:hypothetical protein
MWTLVGLPELFLLEMNLSILDCGHFFSGPVRSEEPLESGQSSNFTAFSALPQESETKIQNKKI